MDDLEAPDTPQIYLITPPVFEAEVFAPQLATLLDAIDIACVRLAMSTDDESVLSRAADQCREIAHARDVPLVVERHFQLVERLGLDGVHLTDGSRSVRDTRKALGADAIIGAHCATSRHDGMNAGEGGADYVSFGPLGESALGDGAVVEHDVFAWWSQMIEVPVVAEGALDVGLIEKFAPVTDFFAVGPEIWNAEDPLAALRDLTASLR